MCKQGKVDGQHENRSFKSAVVKRVLLLDLQAKMGRQEIDEQIATKKLQAQKNVRTLAVELELVKLEQEKTKAN